MVEYSEAEWKLIDHFGFRDFAVNSRCMPATLYREMSLNAFVNNLSGPGVDALRRVLAATNECKPYRMTPEFDGLAHF